jgi:hypothetical protein
MSGLIMPFPDPSTVSQTEFETLLDTLRHLLANFPLKLPIFDAPLSRYASLVDLQKSAVDIHSFEVELEGAFAYTSNNNGDGILPILERGPSICVLYPLLKKYYVAYPESYIVKKWVIDIVAAAENVYRKFGENVSKS